MGAWFQALVKSRARTIVLAATALGLAAAAAVPFAWFDDDPLNLRDQSAPSVATLLDLMEDTRVQPYRARVLAPNVDAAARLAARLKRLPEVDSAITIRDLVPSRQADKRALVEEMALILTPLLAAPPRPVVLDDNERETAFESMRTLLDRAQGAIAESADALKAALDRLPRTPASLRQLEEALVGGFPGLRKRLADALDPRAITLASLPAPLRDRQVAADGRALVTIYPKEDLRDRQARDRFVEAVRRIAPSASGAPVRFTTVGETVVGAFRQAAAIAAGLIVLLLFVVLRRLRDVLMVLAPLTLALLFTVAATVVLGTPFNLANIIVLPLVMGLGVAFGIQIVLRQRSEAAGRLLQTSTPRAVIFSALTTIGSFGALAISKHPGTASMGFLLTLSVSLTMLCTLIVLPALLELWSDRRSQP